MTALQKSLSEQRYRTLRSVIFFACFYIYVWRVIEPYLLYSGYGLISGYPAFSRRWMFFKELFSRSSGPVEYAVGFLSHVFYYSWAGALVITGVAWLIWLCTSRLIRLAGWKSTGPLSYVPSLLLLGFYNGYMNPLTAGLSTLTVLFFIILYERIAGRNIAVSLTLFIFMTILLFYLAGGASVLFVAMIVFYRLFIRRMVLISGIYLAVGLAAVWFAGVEFFGLEPREAYLLFSLFHPNIKRTPGNMLPLYFNLCIILVVVFAGFFDKVLKHRYLGKPKTTEKTKKPNTGKGGGNFQTPKSTRPVETAILILTSVIIALFSFNSEKKNKCRTMYLEQHQKWAELTEHIGQIPANQYDSASNHCVNKALYYLGRLGEEMFGYPQKKYPLLLIPTKNIYPFQLLSSKILTEMGAVNIAEKQSYEFLENTGNHYQILKQLGIINMVKQQPEAASVYLTILSKDLIHGNEGKALLSALAKDGGITEVSEVRRLQAIMPTEQQVLGTNIVEDVLLKLLEKDRQNKMAFEYLMAYYLLDKRLDKFVKNLWRLDDFDYVNIPRHYEEAILLYTKTTKKKVELHGRRIREQRGVSFLQFSRTINRYRQNKNAAMKALSADFRDNYMFYYYFGTSGARK